MEIQILVEKGVAFARRRALNLHYLGCAGRLLEPLVRAVQLAGIIKVHQLPTLVDRRDAQVARRVRRTWSSRCSSYEVSLSNRPPG
ncbi:hypothetical protein RJ55_07165 [Drechmeria coniospora]|nr:hypothetical protein RJ55_07165 [Drechmeria coniospora]